jgi:hypothetical protein
MDDAGVLSNLLRILFAEDEQNAQAFVKAVENGKTLRFERTDDNSNLFAVSIEGVEYGRVSGYALLRPSNFYQYQ